MKAPLTIIAALLTAAVLRCASVWSELPAVMASHFDGAGRANGFQSRDAFFVLFGAVGGGTVALLLVMPWLSQRLPPSLLNVPNREYWLVPERLAQVQDKLGKFMAWTAVGTVGLLIVVLELVLRANLGRGPLASGPLWLIIGAYMIGTTLSIVWLVRAFRVPTG